MKKPSSKKPHYQIVSVGSVVRDISFRTDLADVIDNPKKDPTKLKLIAFEYGAKIRSNDIAFTMGGGAANTAAGLKKLGLKNAIMVRVGDDEEGVFMAEQLSKAKIDTSLLQTDPKLHTGMSFLVIESKTNEHVALVHYGANEALQLTEIQLHAFSTDWFYVSSLSQTNWAAGMRQLAKAKAKSGASNIAWNPGATQLAKPEVVQGLLKHIEVLILNKDEATELALATGYRAPKVQPTSEKAQIQDLLFHLHLFGSTQVLITNGRKGSTVYDGEHTYFAKPSPDKPVDTTGAGDCFGSSYVAGLIKTKGNIHAALQIAVINSTSLVSKPGSQNGLLTWPEIQRKIKR